MREVYCVKRWMSDGSHHNNYFVGNIESADASGFEKPYTIINDEIFFDDKASAIADKIAKHMCTGHCNPWDVYMWVESKIDDRMGFANELARNMMRNKRNITGDEIVTMLRKIIDYDVEFTEEITYERIRHSDLYDILRKSSMNSVLRRLNFEYSVEINYEYIFNVSPLRADVLDITDEPKIFKDTSNTTIYEYLPVNNVINVMLRDDFAKYVESSTVTNFYFPPNVQSSRIVITTGNDALYSTIVQDIDNYYEKSFYKKIFLSIYPIGPTVQTKLQSVFQNFVLDSVCPLIKHRSQSNTTYKVDIGSLMNVEKSIISIWTNEVVFGDKKESIVFKIFYGDFFVTLALFPTMVYHVKLTFKSAQVDDMNYVLDRVLPFINHVLGKIRDMVTVESIVNNITIPLLTHEMINKQNILEVNTVSIQNYRTKLPKLAEIKKRMAALGGVFYNLGNDFRTEKDTLTYKYTRSNGYNPRLDIRTYIRENNRGKSKQELVDEITQIYKVRREAVQSIYDDFTSTENDNHRALLKSYEGLTVKLVRKNDFELLCGIKGSRIDNTILTHISGVVKALVLNDKVTAPDYDTHVVVEQNEEFDPNELLGDDIPISIEREQHESFEDRQTLSDTDDATDDTTESSKESPGVFSVKKYILKRLKNADRALFDFDSTDKNYKSYASLCASNAKRQPMVVSNDKLKEITAKYPGAITNVLKTGSTPEKAEEHAYICPKIWCTESEVAMTPQQFAKMGCPHPNDKVLKLYNDNNENKPKFASFLDPSRHPKEMCVPCCFFVDHGNKLSGKLKKRFAKCKGKDVHDTEEESMYIKGLVFPLEKNRYGRLPYTTAKYLDCLDCHKQPKTGTCFVRKGLQHNSQFFIACMVAILQIDDVHTPQEMVEYVATHMQPYDFVALNNGNTLRAFVDNTTSITNDAEQLQEFRDWFMSKTDYIARFNLGHLAKLFDKPTDQMQDHREMEQYAELQREYMVYASMMNFFNYMRSDFTKGHDVLLQLFSSEWINKQKLNIIVIEDDGVDKVYAACPQHINVQHSAHRGSKCAIVLKYKDFYDTVYEISYVNGAFIEKNTFEPSQYEKIENLYKFYESSCSGLTEDLMRANENHVMVINAAFKGVGKITSDGYFIPYEHDTPFYANDAYVHENMIDKFIVDKHQTVEESLRRLRTFGDTNFYGEAVAHKNGIGVIMGDGSTYVPVLTGDHTDYMYGHLTYLHVFTDVKLPNRSQDYIEQWNMKQAAYNGYKKYIVLTLLANPEFRQEFEFIRFEHNPFPRQLRVEHMMKLVRRVSQIPNVLSVENNVRLADSLLFQDLTLLTSEEYVEKSDVVFLTQTQVDAGELDVLLKSKQPYKKYARGIEDVLAVR